MLLNGCFGWQVGRVSNDDVGLQYLEQGPSHDCSGDCCVDAFLLGREDSPGLPHSSTGLDHSGGCNGSMVE